MEIVTGHRGTPHVTPYKVRDFNIGIVGAEDYVMNGGSELEAQLVSNNRIDIKDGSICMQGTHAVIPKNINDELTIENGMQGEKRIDLIVARYEKVSDSGVESVNTVVLQGTPSKESPIVPGHVVGDIRNGDLKHEMPLYEVELDGINVVEVRPVFKKIVSAAEQQKMIELLNGNCIKVVDSKKTTTNGYNYEYSVLSFGDKRYVKLFGNYTIKNVTGTSFPPFVYNTMTNLGLFPVNITTKIKKVLDFSLNCFNPGSGLFLIGGIKKHIATTNAYADVQFLMTNPPQNIGLEWMMVCEIE